MIWLIASVVLGLAVVALPDVEEENSNHLMVAVVVAALVLLVLLCAVEASGSNYFNN